MLTARNIDAADCACVGVGELSLSILAISCLNKEYLNATIRRDAINYKPTSFQICVTFVLVLPLWHREDGIDKESRQSIPSWLDHGRPSGFVVR
jgi:hypothetical protein